MASDKDKGKGKGKGEDKEVAQDEDRKPFSIASKEGLILASLAVAGIFLLLRWGFASKLEDTATFQVFSAFFFLAYLILLVTGLFIVIQKPGVIFAEFLGLIFFVIGGVTLFILPYAGANQSMEVPFPPMVAIGGGSVFYSIGMFLFIWRGGFFTPWVVGAGLAMGVHVHEAAGAIGGVGHNGMFGRFDQQLWTFAMLTMLIAFALYLWHIVKLHVILAPMISKGNKARRAGDLDKALKQFNRALFIYPTYTTALNNKGNVLFNKGEYEDSKRCYEKALKIDPYYATAKRNLLVVDRVA